MVKGKRKQRMGGLGSRAKRLANPRGQGKRAAKGVATVFRAGLKMSRIYGAKCPG